METRKITTIGLALMLAGVSMHAAEKAAAAEGQFYIAPGVQWMDFDGDRLLDDDHGPGLGLGYGLSDNLDIELMGSRIKPDTLAGGRERLRHLRLDMLYRLGDISNRVSPFFAGGIGDNDFRGNQDETLFNIGAGVNVRLSDNIDWRTSARSFFAMDDSHHDFGLGTSLVFRFGGGGEEDRVPPTPAPEPEPQSEPVDSDGDGVPDERDECADTPSNHAVDDTGCTIMEEDVARVELNVQFEFDRTEVRQEYYSDIRQVAGFLEEYENAVADLEGHTCSIGTEPYNQDLSERRAEAVRQVLIEEFDVDPERVNTAGYGESRPLVSNETREGRERNRRVVSTISTTVERPVTTD